MVYGKKSIHPIKSSIEAGRGQCSHEELAIFGLDYRQVWNQPRLPQIVAAKVPPWWLRRTARHETQRETPQSAKAKAYKRNERNRTPQGRERVPESGECLPKKIKGPRPGRKCRDVRYRAQVVHELSAEYALKQLLKASGQSRSTYYYHLKQRRDRYADERSRVKAVHAQNRGRYGYRRIVAQLRNEGYAINRKTVYRLMKEEGLKNVRRRCKYRSYKGEVGKTAPNRIKRDFNTKAPNRKWTTDVTQINIGMDKCYLSPILDMYNGEIVSYTISDHPDLKMVMDMLDRAFAQGRVWNRLILHSDQGWHYQHAIYQKSLKDHKIIQSMSRKGNCLDNAMMENFFGVMKSELLYPNTFQSMDHFKQELRKYIEYYNNDRIKLRLNGMSPVQYRTHNAVLS